MEHCVFCDIINKKIPSFIIDENDDVIVFMSRNNHPLIVPKNHVPDIFELPDILASIIAKETVRIARATKTALTSDGIYVAQTNGKACRSRCFSLSCAYTIKMA